MCEPMDDWPCKFDESPEVKSNGLNLSSQSLQSNAESPGVTCKEESDFTFPSGVSAAEDDDEVTESKIRAFLDEKVRCLSNIYFLINEYEITITFIISFCWLHFNL